MSNIIHFPNAGRPDLEQMTGQTQALRFRIIQTLMGEQGRVPDDPTKILLLSKLLDSIDKTHFMEKRSQQEQDGERSQNQIAKALTAALTSLQTRTATPPDNSEILNQYTPLPGEMDNGLNPVTWETLFPPSAEEDPAD